MPALVLSVLGVGAISSIALLINAGEQRREREPATSITIPLPPSPAPAPAAATSATSQEGSVAQSEASENPPPMVKSPGCGLIGGRFSADVRHGRSFCTAFIPAGAMLGARVYDTVLTLEATRASVNEIISDKIEGEVLVRRWLAGWKAITDSPYASIRVRYRGVQVVEADTGFLGGDTVTIKAR